MANDKAAPSVSLPGTPFFGMQIEKVWTDGDRAVVETTGAVYDVTQRGVEMTRKIDPATNTVKPRRVAALVFEVPVGSWKVVTIDRRECLLTSPGITLKFHSDGVFFLTNLQAAPFRYTHLNAIARAPWDRQKEPCHRMWTDGYGGSLHALARGTVSATPVETAAHQGGTEFSLPRDAQMAHMVFPPRSFDFAALYGSDARPFEVATYSVAQMSALVSRIESDPGFVQDHHLGCARSINAFALEDPRRRWLIQHPELFEYEHLWRRATFPPGEKEAVATEFYQIMSRLHPGRTPPRSYTQYTTDYSLFTSLTEIERMRVARDIRLLHDHGVKFLLGVGLYLAWLPEPHMGLVIDWLKDLVEAYGVDGFYFDNGAYGDPAAGPWYETYTFIRRLRQEAGEHLHIFHHNSNDVWGGREPMPGLRAIMVDTYVNAITSGEVGDIAVVDDPAADYLRYFSCGYGFSQAQSHNIRFSRYHGALSEQEKVRVVGAHLNGSQPLIYGYTGWDLYMTEVWGRYLDFYRQRRQSYLDDPARFSPDVAWPPAWFRRIGKVTVTPIIGINPDAPLAADVEWVTGGELTDYHVAYFAKISGQEGWWEEEREEGQPDTRYWRLRAKIPRVVSPPGYAGSHHLVQLTDLEPGQTYKLRVRCAKQPPGAEKIVWGYAGEFQTPGVAKPGEEESAA
jgi:hypothetical protein